MSSLTVLSGSVSAVRVSSSTSGFYGIGFLLIGGGILFLVNKQKKIKLINEACALVKNAPVTK